MGTGGRGETRGENRACEKSEETKVLGSSNKRWKVAILGEGDDARKGYTGWNISRVQPTRSDTSKQQLLFIFIDKKKIDEIFKFLQNFHETFLPHDARNVLNQFYHKWTIKKNKIPFCIYSLQLSPLRHTRTHTILRLSQPLKFPFSKYTTQRPITTKQSLLPTSSQQLAIPPEKETTRGAKEFERKRERKNSSNYNPRVKETVRGRHG